MKFNSILNNHFEKSGWPWSAEIPDYPPSLPDGSSWPRISIVTPSFNQAQFLEETIRSVLLQGYPNLEYIIIDGGSTDGSVEIIKKYEPWLAHWVSEPDRGQSHAINKGFEIAMGELGGWLNSDDIYLPGALKSMVLHWLVNDQPNSIITGTKLKGNNTLESTILIQQFPFTIEHLLGKCILEQPATFFPLHLFRKVGGIDESYKMALDYDLWLRMTRHGADLYFSGVDLAITRNHSLTKSSRFQRLSTFEALKSVWKNYGVVSETWLKKYITALIIPRGIRGKLLNQFFYGIRNTLYELMKKIFSYLHLLWKSEANN